MIEIIISTTFRWTQSFLPRNHNTNNNDIKNHKKNNKSNKNIYNFQVNTILSITEWNREPETCISGTKRCDGRFIHFLCCFLYLYSVVGMVCFVFVFGVWDRVSCICIWCLGWCVLYFYLVLGGIFFGAKFD